MFGLPSTVEVRQPLPKKAFYSRLSLAAPVKDEFVSGIEALCVVAAIKEAACGIPAADGIDEISVLRVDLKTDTVPERALAAVTQAVPRKLLWCAAMRAGRALPPCATACKWVPSWCSRINCILRFPAPRLPRCGRAYAPRCCSTTPSVEDVDARLATEKRIQELEAQTAQLKRKYAKEVQPSKRNAAFKAYKQAKAELSLLKGE